MLWREETQGSKGNLFYHPRYKRILSIEPEEKAIPVYMQDNDLLNKGGVTVVPYTVALSGLLFFGSVNYTSPLLPLFKLRSGFSLSSLTVPF